MRRQPAPPDRGPARRRRASPYFDGDNFGATYQGVTRDEIRILFYIDGGIGTVGTSRGAARRAPPNSATSTSSTTSPRRTSATGPRAARRGRSTSTSATRPTAGTCTSSCTSAPAARAPPEEPHGPTRPRTTAASSRSRRSTSRTFEGGGDAYVDIAGQARRAQLRLVRRAGRAVLPALPQAHLGLPAVAQRSRPTSTPGTSAATCTSVATVDPQRRSTTGSRASSGSCTRATPASPTLRRFKDAVMAKFDGVRRHARRPSAARSRRPATRVDNRDAATGTRSRRCTRSRQRASPRSSGPAAWRRSSPRPPTQLGYCPEWIVAGDGADRQRVRAAGLPGSHGRTRSRGSTLQS